jgi:hypothetical protein
VEHVLAVAMAAPRAGNVVGMYTLEEHAENFLRRECIKTLPQVLKITTLGHQ